MKTLLIILVAFSFTNYISAQENVDETKKIATYCKVWGFLKYYHPSVAKGQFDWDNEFRQQVKSLYNLNSKEEISSFYLDWIHRLGEVKKCRASENQITDSLTVNLDLSFITDTSMFNSDLLALFKHIQNNRNTSKNYYVKQTPFIGNAYFNHEKTYTDSVYPSAELRLLGLSRYWNIINYFFSYKYKTDENWNDVLLEMIPKFRNAQDTISYHLAMLELTAKINDSHAEFFTKYTSQYFGLKWAPFIFKIIDTVAIVTSFYDDSLCRKDDIRLGDVFLKVNNSSIHDIITQKLKYIGSSNYSAGLRNLYYVIFNGQSDSSLVVYERNGVVSHKYIHRYYFPNFKVNRKTESKSNTYRIINDSIAYVNIEHLYNNQISAMMRNLKNTCAIIFDIRGYPNWTVYSLAEFLNEKRKPFAKFTLPNINYPGVYYYTKPTYCGKQNKNYYKGKVIILMNERTQSQAEFTIMALQTAPKAVTVGSQTAGADGDISIITFPGGYKTYMSGIGVYYPDGQETQRIGIRPDVEVKPTIEGLRLDKDEVLEKAIEVAGKKSSDSLQYFFGSPLG